MRYIRMVLLLLLGFRLYIDLGFMVWMCCVQSIEMLELHLVLHLIDAQPKPRELYLLFNSIILLFVDVIVPSEPELYSLWKTQFPFMLCISV